MLGYATISTCNIQRMTYDEYSRLDSKDKYGLCCIIDNYPTIDTTIDSSNDDNRKRMIPRTHCDCCGAPLPKYDIKYDDIVECKYCLSIQSTIKGTY